MPNRQYRWPPGEFALWTVWITAWALARMVRPVRPALGRAGRRTVELWGDLQHLRVETLFALATVLGGAATVALWLVTR